MSDEPKRPRGRPALTGMPGKRFMIHLPPKTATLLRAVGSGSISLGVIRMADTHAGEPLTAGPPPRTVKQIKATERARRRAQEALDVVNQMLTEKIQADAPPVGMNSERAARERLMGEVIDKIEKRKPKP